MRQDAISRFSSEVIEAVARRHRQGAAGRITGTILDRGDGWQVDDMVCTLGPADRGFEERHDRVVISVVLAGTFQYRSPIAHELLTPGSFLLGNPGEYFTCGHEHGSGDRCVAFRFTPDYFEQIAADLGIRTGFAIGRLPAIRETARASATTAMGLGRAGGDIAWDELGVELAATALRLANGGTAKRAAVSRAALGRISESVRAIERDPTARLPLTALAAAAKLSPFHYLRSFEQVTGVTPHQFILRTRLREAATRIAAESSSIVEVAFGSGFGDLSNFNRAFRAEFGTSPRGFRATRRGNTA